ncbi:hypothetical protein IU500_09155 [Nocardia terpenica]|uniref:hypothetical protein n=1 Tax=Nocardia terpenica TaxID=455432 RepID=UPI0002FE858E|nr:hypothetical protein [Nocardia terpenica]MBF6062119.1 hypothetical protein [Nocardia terpenica]MBF6104207.1 hypothetical protein [Nocardia terpenica]MBF6109937.1 hypothetical protein [Nocardia terpenica]MBF6120243.1 hypothetical protein [Nocardia terpenica]MBF6152654.1 hypothetical protein [Nocardia terpenica]
MRFRFGRAAAPAVEDYGLLVAVATVSAAATAQGVRNLLQDNGIRATIGPAHAERRGGQGRLRILVFPEDAGRAYELLCTNTF